MVKNLKGGSKSKQMGRKFVTAPVDRKVRLIHEEGELYAVVTKLLGNGMFTANDIEGKERLVVMRNKFRGKDPQKFDMYEAKYKEFDALQNSFGN